MGKYSFAMPAITWLIPALSSRNARSGWTSRRPAPSSSPASVGEELFGEALNDADARFRLLLALRVRGLLADDRNADHSSLAASFMVLSSQRTAGSSLLLGCQ